MHWLVIFVVKISAFKLADKRIENIGSKLGTS